MDNSSGTTDAIKDQIGKLSKNNFMFWPLSLIIIIMSRFFLEDTLIILGLIVIAIMFIKSIKLIILLNTYFKILYELYGPHPSHKRNALLISYANIGLVGLAMFLFYQHGSLLLISLILIVSFFLFAVLGASLSGSVKEN